MMIPKSGGPATGSSGIHGHGRKIAGHRPRCVICSGDMRLARISPAKNSAVFKVEYIFECICGEWIAIDEGDLLTARA